MHVDKKKKEKRKKRKEKREKRKEKREKTSRKDEAIDHVRGRLGWQQDEVFQCVSWVSVSTLGVP